MLGLLSFKLVVYCDDENEQIRRLMKRNPELGEKQARARIESQLGMKEKMKMADVCIDNSRDLEHTREQIDRVYSMLAKSKKYVWIRVAFLSILVGAVFSLFKLIF